MAIVLLMMTLSNTARSQYANPNPVCYGDPIKLFCSGLIGCGMTGSTYTWFAQNGTWTSNLMNPVIYPGPDYLPGRYYLSIQYLPEGLSSALVDVVFFPQIIINATVVPMSCSPGNDASIILQVSGGSPMYTYNWNTGPQTSSISGLGAGIYTVTVTDGNMCTATQSWQITSIMSIAGTLHKATCSPGHDGWIDLSVFGGCTPFSYIWNTTAQTQDIYNLTCGTYTVTVTSGSNSTVTASWLYEDVFLDAVVTQAYGNNNCNNGTIDISASGGTTPYAYLWSNWEYSQDITGLSNGTYCVTVTDNHGVSRTCCYEVASNNYSLRCYGDPIYLYCCGIQGCGVAGASYFWTNTNASWTSTAMNPVIPSGTATDSYYLTIQYPPNSMSSGMIQVFVPPKLTVSATIIPMSCSPGNDASIVTQVSGGTPLYGYQWSNGKKTSTITGLSPGIYSVTVTDANGCTTFASWIVIQGMTVSGTLYKATCSPGHDAWIDLSVSGGCTPYSYNWNTGPKTQDIYNLACGNTYTVTVTDGSNSTVTASWLYKDVLLDAVITQAFGNNKCNNGAIDLTVSCGVSPYTYQWSNTKTTRDITGLTAGTYCVTVTDNHGTSRTCCYVIVNSSNIFCYGDPIILNCCGIPGCGMAGSTYTWYSASTSWTSSQMSPVITSGPEYASGQFYVAIQYPPSGLSSGVVSVTLLSPITINATILPISCSSVNSGAIFIQTSGGMPQYGYLWNTMSTNPWITGLTCGTYTVTVTDANNCTAVGSWKVNTNLAIAGTLYKESCSPGGDAWIDLVVSGGCTPYSYQWNTGPKTQDISNLTCGNYYTVTVTDAFCGYLTASWKYEDVILRAVVQPESGAGCSDGSINLSVSCGTPLYSYIWDFGPFTEDVSGLPGGTYCVTVSDAFNISRTCCWVVTTKKTSCQSNYLQDLTITNGMNHCYDALQNIVVAGNGTYFIIEPGGSATMIAGERIRYLPGAKVYEGGFMHGYITTEAQYCNVKNSGGGINSSDTGLESAASQGNSTSQLFRVYPNPTTGNFTFELTGEDIDQKMQVEIYTMRGEKIMAAELKGDRKHEFSLAAIPSGLYYIRVVTGKYTGTGKIIRL